MKLFELYQQNTQQGTDNLKQISEAVENKTSAVITVGNTQVKLGINSARYIFGLYETAVANGTSEKFLEGLTNLNTSTLMENDNTMRHIVSKFKHEVKNFIAGDDLDTDLYHALYDYYSDHGELPYGIAKARDGDPFEWVTMRFDRDVHDYAGPDDLNPDVPAAPPAPAATMPMMPRQESMYESKQVKEGWAEMMAATKARAEKEKAGRGTGKFDKKSTGTGTVYSRKYNTDTGQSIEPTIDPEGKPPVKRSVGRPSAGVSGSNEEGTKFGEYSSWYHKSKRTHAGAGIVGSRANALAVVPKGAKYLVVGKWTGEDGTMFSAPKEIISKDELAKYQAGRGRRSTKVREWIETLRFVSEGTTTKTATGIKHTAKDKYGAGEEERAPQDPGKYARDLDSLNKNLTSKLDKSMGIKNDRGPKKK